jgi:hypothetical protein
VVPSSKSIFTWPQDAFIIFRDSIHYDVSGPKFLFVLATRVTTTTTFAREVCPLKSSVAIWTTQADIFPSSSALVPPSQTSRKHLLVILFPAVTNQRESRKLISVEDTQSAKAIRWEHGVVNIHAFSDLYERMQRKKTFSSTLVSQQRLCSITT